MREVLIESWAPPHLVVSEILYGAASVEKRITTGLCIPQPLLFLRLKISAV